jgi:hypothetical protein
MKRLVITVVGLLFSGVTFAGASSFVDVGLVIGGENGQDGGGDNGGIDITGAWAIDDTWYIGGVGGRYSREGNNGDTDYTYLAFNGGAVIAVTESTNLYGEAAIWVGEQDNPGNNPDADPKAIEAKTGINTKVGDKLSLGASISLVAADLDTANNDDLRNFVWSAGGAWAFTPNMSVQLKLIEGSNGVNGQNDVVRLGFRWTF